MNLPVVPSAAANNDLDSIADYLSEQSVGLGARFYDCVQRTFERLSQLPEVGAIVPFRDPDKQNVRVWQVAGFRNYILFYRIEPMLIDVLRVLHGAMDYYEEKSQ